MRASRICGLVLSLVVLGGHLTAQPRAGDEAARLLAAGRYVEAEAAARADFDRIRAESGESSLPAADAGDRLVAALVLNGYGAVPDTEDLARRMLHARESLTGAADPSLLPSLLNLADALLASADHVQALAIADRAARLAETTGRAESPQALDRVGSALTDAGRYAEAVRTLERSLALKESAGRADGRDLAATLERLGLALQRQGDYRTAAGFVRRAVGMHEAAGPEHPAHVASLNLLAQQLWFEGDLPASRDASLRAVAAAERLLRTDHPTTARAIRYLAGAVFYLGDLRRAAELWARALAMIERTLGPAHAETAMYAHDVALAEMELGQYPAARDRFTQALAVFERRFGPWHDYVANTTHNLALVHARLGDRARARREQTRALDIWTRVYGPSHPFLGVALTELATVLRDQGAPLEALPLLERALAIRERALGPAHPDVARTLADLAVTLVRAGRPARAQALASRALDIWSKLEPSDAPEYATVLALRAGLALSRGEYAAATEYYERALRIRERVFGSDSPSHAEAQIGLALSLARLGRGQEALLAAAAAEATGREHLRLLLRSLPEPQALAYADARPRGLDLMLSLVAASVDAPVRALDGVVRARGLVLDEMAIRRRAAGAVAQTDPLRTAYVAAQQRLANLIVRGVGQLTPPQYVTAVDAARRDAADAEQTFARRSATFRVESAGARVGLDEVARALPDDGALVSFVRYGRSPQGGVSAGVTSGPGRLRGTVTSYLAFVLRPGRAPVAVALGSSAAIEPLVSGWRSALLTEARLARPGSGASSSRQSGAALRRRVWDPLALHLEGARRVFIVPDGMLGLVPFAALPVGTRSFVIDGGQVLHYLSAERDLVSLAAAPAPIGRGMLALGGASFDGAAPVPSRPSRASSAARRPVAAAPAVAPAATRAAAAAGPGACGDLRTMRFQPLAGSLDEVREIGRAWSERAGDVKLLVGPDANERSFKQSASQYRVLHLATHGFFIEDAGCVPPARGTRGVGGLAGGGRPSRTRGAVHPLRLSGLALAGANRRFSAGREE
ncbi:MAG: tetratricopeptide repeat protein, partial [Vicinamibacterales bacterium]